MISIFLPKPHYPIPNHEKVESNEHAKNAANVCQEGDAGEGLFLLENLNCVRCIYWPQCCFILIKLGSEHVGIILYLKLF